MATILSLTMCEELLCWKFARYTYHVWQNPIYSSMGRLLGYYWELPHKINLQEISRNSSVNSSTVLHFLKIQQLPGTSPSRSNYRYIPLRLDGLLIRSQLLVVERQAAGNTWFHLGLSNLGEPASIAVRLPVT